jgi:hypothetical protein
MYFYAIRKKKSKEFLNRRAKKKSHIQHVFPLRRICDVCFAKFPMQKEGFG